MNARWLKNPALWWLLGTLAVAGCTSSLGGPCQVQSDCNHGLICFLGTNPTVGGHCEHAMEEDMGTFDFAVAQDMAMEPTD